MLTRVGKTKIRGDLDRRWMSDDYLDLIVWYDKSGRVHGFQLCYGKPRWERALTWIKDRGFSHCEIDSGEAQATRNRTPVLLPNDAFPALTVLREFEQRSSPLPKSLRRLVTRKIAQFAGWRRAWIAIGIFVALIAATLLAARFFEA